MDSGWRFSRRPLMKPLEQLDVRMLGPTPFLSSCSRRRRTNSGPLSRLKAQPRPPPPRRSRGWPRGPQRCAPSRSSSAPSAGARVSAACWSCWPRMVRSWPTSDRWRRQIPPLRALTCSCCPFQLARPPDTPPGRLVSPTAAEAAATRTRRRPPSLPLKRRLASAGERRLGSGRLTSRESSSR